MFKNLWVTLETESRAHPILSAPRLEDLRSTPGSVRTTHEASNIFIFRSRFGAGNDKECPVRLSYQRPSLGGD